MRNWASDSNSTENSVSPDLVVIASSLLLTRQIFESTDLKRPRLTIFAYPYRGTPDLKNIKHRQNRELGNRRRKVGGAASLASTADFPSPPTFHLLTNDAPYSLSGLRPPQHSSRATDSPLTVTDSLQPRPQALATLLLLRGANGFAPGVTGSRPSPVHTPLASTGLNRPLPCSRGSRFWGRTEASAQAGQGADALTLGIPAFSGCPSQLPHVHSSRC